MTTDNKTLADVQPGGRVRLGDALPPLPASSAHCPTTGDPLFSASKMTLYAQASVQAALSAQPSPGGQGDVRLLADVDERIATAKALGYEDDIGVGIGLLQCVRSALAARQPVGEPVEQVRETVGRGFIAELLPGVLDRVSNMAPLYLQPPAQVVKDDERAEDYRKGSEAGNAAQAVDLGPVRDVFRRWHANELNSTDAMLALVEALAVIDSQAVGNG